MSIKSYVEELINLEIKIKNNNKDNATCRKRIKELNKQIQAYLTEKDQNGLKYKGKVIMVEEKETRAPKKKKDKEQSVLSLLENAGVDDPKGLYTKIEEAKKGELVKSSKIKVKDIK